MFTLWSDMDRFFNNSFADWMFNPRFRANDDVFGSYRMNLIDKGENIEFIAELPGVEDKDMSLDVHNDTLTLRAKRAVSHNPEDTLYLSEREDYDIKRSVALPAKIDAEKASATLKNGILRVVLPKAPESQPRQIAINA